MNEKLKFKTPYQRMLFLKKKYNIPYTDLFSIWGNTLDHLSVKYLDLKPYEVIKKRQEYIKTQGNKCWYCQNDIYDEPTDEVLKKKIDWKRFPEGFMNHPIHLQHDHATGYTEGAVHSYCNAVLWQYERR